jgi:choline transport protein
MVITMCFCLPSDPTAFSALLKSGPAEVGYPFVQMFADSVQSVRGATAMTAIIVVLSVACALTNIATGSRQLFAFARDQGVPFSKVLSYVMMLWPCSVDPVANIQGRFLQDGISP